VVWPLGALGALLVLNALVTPHFFDVTVRDGQLHGVLIDIVENGSLVMLVAIGMTLVIATAGVDLSVGSVMALAATGAALLLTEGSQAPAVAIAAGLGLGALAGAANGAMVSVLGLQPIVATLVSLVAMRGIAQMLSDDQKVRFDSAGFTGLLDGRVAGVPAPVLYVTAIAAATVLVLRRTTIGLSLEAVGANSRAARRCGLSVGWIRAGAYGFCGACAALAGMIGAADIREADVGAAGVYMELDVILAVAIGGTSLTGGRARVIGSLAGALLMQTLTTTLLMWDVPTERTLIVKAGVAVVVCVAQSPRLIEALGRHARRKPPRRRYTKVTEVNKEGTEKKGEGTA
jgi:simple sugar transport system permease protein